MFQKQGALLLLDTTARNIRIAVTVVHHITILDHWRSDWSVGEGKFKPGQLCSTRTQLVSPNFFDERMNF